MGVDEPPFVVVARTATGREARMAGQDPDPGAEIASEELDLGDVLAAPGEVVGVADGKEVRHEVDDRDIVLPIEDDDGELIGKESFPETPS
jgi:hypothetical protein